MLSTRNQAVVMERDAGRTVTEIGERFGITHQRVSQVCHEATSFVDRVEMDLLAATRTGEECIYLVPFGHDYQLAMAFGDWLVRRLRARGVKVRVRTEHAANGLALLLSDVTPYTKEEAR